MKNPLHQKGTMKFTVRQRLITLIAATCLIFTGLCIALLLQMNSANSALEAMYRGTVGSISTVGEIDGLLTRADVNILRMIAIGDPQSIATWKQENAERFNTVDKLLDLLASSTTGERQSAVKNLSGAYHKMRSGMEHQIERIEAGDIKGGAEVNRLEVKDNATQVFSILSDMKKSLSDTAKASFEQQQGIATSTSYISSAAIAFVSGLSMLIGLLLARGVVGELGQIRDTLTFRLRTPASGLNGMNPALYTGPVLSLNHPSLVAAVYDGRVSRLYVDGKLVGEMNLGAQRPRLPRRTMHWLPRSLPVREIELAGAEILASGLFAIGIFALCGVPGGTLSRFLLGGAAGGAIGATVWVFGVSDPGLGARILLECVAAGLVISASVETETADRLPSATVRP